MEGCVVVSSVMPPATFLTLSTEEARSSEWAIFGMSLIYADVHAIDGYGPTAVSSMKMTLAVLTDV
jgi:hypothetical protein